MNARAAALGTSTDPGMVWLAPDPEPRTTDTAARVLAAVPKPLRIGGVVRDGVLVVQYAAVPPHSPRPVTLGPRPEGLRLSSERPEHRAMGFLHERHGPDVEHLPVACFGAGDAVRATVFEVRAWKRDYRHHEPTGRMLGVTSHMSELPDPFPPGLFRDVPAAVLEGAVAFLRFVAADEKSRRHWILAPDSAPAVFCEDCGTRRATGRTRERELGYWREHYWCAACGLTEHVTPGVAEEWPDAEQLASFEHGVPARYCVEFAQAFVRAVEKSGLPMPPHIAAFVTRHLSSDT